MLPCWDVGHWYTDQCYVRRCLAVQITVHYDVEFILNSVKHIEPMKLWVQELVIWATPQLGNSQLGGKKLRFLNLAPALAYSVTFNRNSVTLLSRYFSVKFPVGLSATWSHTKAIRCVAATFRETCVTAQKRRMSRHWIKKTHTKNTGTLYIRDPSVDSAFYFEK